MKKTILTILIGLFSMTTNAQIKPYIQLEGGQSVEQTNIKTICAEFGVNYKWFDFGLVYGTEGNLLFDNYYQEDVIIVNKFHSLSNSDFTSFSRDYIHLLVKIDVLKPFIKNSRHSIKIVGGGGLGIYKKSSHCYGLDKETGNSKKIFLIRKGFSPSANFKVSYDYKVTPKLQLGAYFGGSYYPSVGLLIRGNF